MGCHIPSIQAMHDDPTGSHGDPWLRSRVQGVVISVQPIWSSVKNPQALSVSHTCTGAQPSTGPLSRRLRSGVLFGVRPAIWWKGLMTFVAHPILLDRHRLPSQRALSRSHLIRRQSGCTRFPPLSLPCLCRKRRGPLSEARNCDPRMLMEEF